MTGVERGDFPSKVLVVDDESVILQLLTTALNAEDLPVRTVLTAEQAEQALAAERFGCLLVDKNLPGMDGIELLRRTRKLQPHCACLVESRAEAAPLRGEIARVVRQLEDHLELLS